MSDPLAEVIAMLNLQSGADQNHRGGRETGESGARIRGCRFAGVVLEGGCRLEIDQHEPQILRAGDFILIPAACRFSPISSTSPLLHRRWKPSRCNWRRDTFGWAPSTSLRTCRR